MPKHKGEDYKIRVVKYYLKKTTLISFIKEVDKFTIDKYI